MSTMRWAIVFAAMLLVASCQRATSAPATTRPSPIASDDRAPKRHLSPLGSTAELIELLGSKDYSPAEKVEACQSLELRGPAVPEAAPALVAALGADEPVRFHAKRALIAIGPGALPAVQKFAEGNAPGKHQPPAAEDSSAHFDRAHVAAFEAWAQIDVDQNVSTDVLKDRRDHGDFAGSLSATFALHLKDQQVSAIADARRPNDDIARELKRLHRGSVREQLDAIGMIRFWGPDVASLGWFLRPLLDSPRPQIASAAADALRDLGIEAIPYLLNALKSPDEHARLLAVIALAYPYTYLLHHARRFDVIDALQTALDDPAKPVAIAAAQALCQYNLDAHPALVRAMQKHNQAAKDAVIEQLLTRPRGFTDDFAKDWLAGVKFDPATIHCENELAGLVQGDLLARAENGDQDDASSVIEALKALPPQAVGEAGVKVLLQSLEKKYGRNFMATTPNDVSSMGIGSLLDLAQQHDSPRRASAIEALAKFPEAQRDPKIAAILTADLADPLYSIRAAAFRWAVTLPDPSPTVLARVTAMLSDYAIGHAKGDDLAEYNSWRASAVEMLGKFPSPDAAAPIISCLDDVSYEVRLAAIVALRRYHDIGQPALAQLAKTTASQRSDEAKEAAATLLACGREGRRMACDYYLKRMRDFPDDRAATLAALAIIGPDAAAAVPELQTLLGSDDNALRIEIADTLGEIGPRASAAVPALVRMMDNPSFDIRQSASLALAKISPAGKGLGGALLAAIYNNDRAAAERLAATMRGAADGKKLLARIGDLAANDPDAAVRATAHRAVEVLSSEAAPAAATQPGR
ncbi:MAG TPA: HEAT repeat domain-containing protein [Tepidisphaeraceae bacterium]|jgi:HEAT repeat protein|nr:HEAT repeat domain-containing protein [Tepidisphaeraceae bacterium]